MNKWLSGSIYLVIIIIFYSYKNEILHWMQYSQAPISIAFLIALGFIIIPVMPYKIIIGILGYMYGPLLGAFISWLAASSASLIVFVLVRYYFQKQGRAYLSKFKKLKKLQTTIERNPFFTILLARIIPVIPQAIVNIYPAITTIRLSTFTVASALGKIPAMLLFAFIGQNLFTDLNKLFISISIYVLFLALVYLIYRIWLKERMK